MNTEDSEFARIEREQAMRGVPDPIHHTDTSEPLMYIQGWNDCRQAMLVEQPAQQEPWLVFLRNNPKASCETVGAWLRGHAEYVTGERFYFPQQPAQQEPVYHLRQYGDVTKEQLDRYMATGDITPQPAPVQQEPEIVQRVKRYAGQTLRTARNPNITARECIELADWLATTPQAQRNPLTDEQMAKAWAVADGEHNASASVKRRITRAIEAKVKENNA